MRFLRYWRARRAFKKLPRSDRRIVVYSESGQDWHHFELLIRHLTGPLGRKICYVSSDEDDPGLKQDDPSIIPFCIGSGLMRIIFFQTLEADVLFTQMLDLDNLDLKRSVHPVHYVYMFHSLISAHMADREDSFDHYDSILCAGPRQWEEIRKRESMYDLKPKQLFEHGYERLEQIMADRRDPPPMEGDQDIHILLAPSWGPETILNVCGFELTGILLDAGFRVTVRPHYQTRWITPEVIDRIVAGFGDREGFRLIEQMGESESLFDSHLMISDWSGAGMDYGLGLEKPVLYIDVPPKTRNDTWPALGIEPFESYVRDKIGAVLSPECLEEAPELIRGLLADPGQFRRQVRELREESVYNLGHAGEAGAIALAKIADGVVGAG